MHPLALRIKPAPTKVPTPMRTASDKHAIRVVNPSFFIQNFLFDFLALDPFSLAESAALTLQWKAWSTRVNLRLTEVVHIRRKFVTPTFVTCAKTFRLSGGTMASSLLRAI